METLFGIQYTEEMGKQEMNRKVSTYDMMEIARIGGECTTGKWKMCYTLRPQNNEGFYTEIYKLFYDDINLLEVHSKSRDKKQWLTQVKFIEMYSSYQLRVVTKFVHHFGLFTFNTKAYMKGGY